MSPGEIANIRTGKANPRKCLKAGFVYSYEATPDQREPSSSERGRKK